MTRRPAAVLALSALILVIAGCSGVPGSGAAVDVTRIAEQVAPVVPAAPTAGQQPD